MQGTVHIAVAVMAFSSLLTACSPAPPTGAPTALPVYLTPSAVVSPLSEATIALATATKPTVAPTPSSTSTATPVQWFMVANTDGIGVYLRKSPNMDDKILALPDGTRLRVIGPDTENEGRRWKQVSDPAGQVGWVPAEYTVPVAGP